MVYVRQYDSKYTIADKEISPIKIAFLDDGTSKTVQLTHMNETTPLMIHTIKSMNRTNAKGGKHKEYITVLGRKRLIVQKGRTKYVTVKGELVKISEAKALDTKIKKDKMMNYR